MVDSVRDIASVSQRSSGAKHLLSWDLPQNYKRWLAWWYLAIAGGFAALALDHLLLHDAAWLIGLRVVLSAGFGFLAWMEFRTRKR